MIGDAHTAGTLAKDCYPLGVAAERANIFTNPFQNWKKNHLLAKKHPLMTSDRFLRPLYLLVSYRITHHFLKIVHLTK